MPFDIFISYARHDDSEGYITKLVEHIKNDFAIFSVRPLVTFFDKADIHGMEEWRHKILLGLRESRILLAFLSPAYLKSEYCEWEFVEYLKHEIGRTFFGEGVATIYFVDVPGWNDKDFEQKCANWIAELRHRQNFDFRPWFSEGEESLRNNFVKERIQQLNIQLQKRIKQTELAENSIGNIDAHNPHFIGRTIEMRRLREQFVKPGTIGVLTAVHGLGGVGKTALAVQYAHAFAEEYGGGRWQVRCEGKEDLLEAIAGLAAPLALEFNEEEKESTDRQFQRVMAELHLLAYEHKPQRCLLLLDNVDKPKILEPAQTKHLPAAEWLHILVTTRLGETDLYGAHKDRAFIPIDELPENDALELIQIYQPGGVFSSVSEQEAAMGIINILDRFTLAVEMAAVYLGQYATEITCEGFLTRLEKEGLAGLTAATKQTTEGLRHGEKCLVATLTPTLERLTDPEKLTLNFGALLPSHHIALPWIRTLVAEKFPEIGKDSEPGYPDPWKNILRHLLSLRLIQITNLSSGTEQLVTVKMHSIVGQIVLSLSSKDTVKFVEIILKISGLIYKRSFELCSRPVNNESLWELDCLFRTIKIWLNNNRFLGQSAGIHCCSALREYGRYKLALELAELIIESIENGKPEPNVSNIWCHNIAGIAALHMDDTVLAESHFFSARRLSESPGTDDLDRLDTLTNISCLYRSIFRPDLAYDPSREALEISEIRFGKNSPEAGIRLANLGLVLQDLCNLDEAIPLFQKAVEIDLSKPELVLRACQDLSTLAEALRNAEQLEEAEIKARQGYELIDKSGFLMHPVAMNTKLNLACILEEQGFFDEAEKLYESACDIAIKCYGEKSTKLSLCLNNLGVLSLLRGNISNAIAHFNNSLKIEHTQKNPKKQNLAHHELNLGVAFLLSDDPVNSLKHIQAGWDYKTEIGRSDLLTARLLLARLAASFSMKENYDLFIGQLNTLLSGKVLPASGINVKWSLEKPLKLKINRFSTEQVSKWNLYCKLLCSKTFLNSNIELDIPDEKGKRNLNEEWPGFY
jgi:tetratricopeptide (TPR) repeat protein